MSSAVEQVDIINVNGSDMEVFLFKPEGSGPHPAIILAQHIPVGHTGIENDTFTLETARRFSRHGYLVAVPFIFHWWPKEADIKLKRDESRDDKMIADVSATFKLLESRDDTASIGIVGHCWGGRVAWLGACYLSALSACAIFYGGRIKLPMGDGPAPIELAANIKCAVAGFFGNEDTNPTPEDVNDYEAALSAAGIETEFHRYAAAGHAFQNFPTPERYREEQSEDAWGKVFDFLARNLKH